MKQIHGGNIYDAQIRMDFSVNINPLGIPHKAEAALCKAIPDIIHYPQPDAGRLRERAGKYLGVSPKDLIFGNGASELFLAVVHALKPQKTLIPVPSFSGYEYAAGAEEGKLLFYETGKEDGFCLTERFFDVLKEDVDLLFLANPNNPTGALYDREFFLRILDICRQKEIVVVVDECFIDFCENGISLIPKTAEYPNLIVVQAFTKSFALPGIRLGYLVCGNEVMREKIQRHLPEWNTSVPAQAAGMACMEETAFLKESRDYIKKERQFLQAGLERAGCVVYPGEADFLLFYTEKPLYEYLLQCGILIRDCESFRGLSKGYYRIGVRQHEDNVALLRQIQAYEIMTVGEKDGTGL